MATMDQALCWALGILTSDRADKALTPLTCNLHFCKQEDMGCQDELNFLVIKILFPPFST